MTLHILFINETAAIGGAEINLLGLVDELQKQGYQVHVILPETGPLANRLEAIGIQADFVPGVPAYSISVYLPGHHKVPNPLAWALDFYQGVQWIYRLRRRILQNKPDIIQTSGMLAHIFGGLAGKLAGIPVVAHVQDIVSAESGLGLYQRLFYLWAKTVPQKIVCIAPLVERQFSGASLDKHHIQTIWNTVDLKRFTSEKIPAKIGDQPLKIATIARLTPWKGQHIALKVAQGLKEKSIPFEWTFIGDTSLGSEIYLRELQDSVRSLNLEDCVSFAGWMEDVATFYQSLDLLVHTPIEPEPFGLVLAEALASGVPVIASRGGGIDDLVTDEECILVTPGQAAPVAEAIYRLWHAPEEHARMAKAARQLALRAFDAEEHIDQWLSLYREALIK